MLVAMLMGFAAGLPFALIGGTMQAWMTEAKIDLTVIGLMAFITLPFTLKFLWAPLFDRVNLPWLGRRRGWLFLVQLLLAGAILAMGMTNPAATPWLFAVVALCVSFFSASQDILIDAYRRESLADHELGMGSSLYVFAYRMAMYVSGGGALWIADRVPWEMTYAIMAATMGVGLLATLIGHEPIIDFVPPRTMREAVINPFVEYFKRTGALWMLGFILLYKMGEVMATSMTTPMYLLIGFTKSEIFQIVKTFGLAATILGGFAGGFLMLRLKIRRSLFLFGILQGLGLLGFALVARMGHSQPMLATAIFIENFTAGMATTAYAAFMGSLTNKKYTATQYALFTSLMGIPRAIVAAPMGWVAKMLGWEPFFVFCTLMTIPGLLVLRTFKIEENDDIPKVY